MGAEYTFRKLICIRAGYVMNHDQFGLSGGIDSALAAREKLAAGASLVQIYSGFIYKGPPLIRDIVENIK